LSFWHNKAPHLLFSISYCLTNGVQFSAQVVFYGQKSLAEFAPAGANKVRSVFPGDMRVGENTSQPASVALLRQWRSNDARGGLHPAQKVAMPLF
ncbi:hypothetical protein, partial [uncultured Flavonifractor sp.]|uniref:hypothetical protein n=1 Tax=uncultured Flavonifractor sp. TaxID=1193534 RepID=UPI00263044F7